MSEVNNQMRFESLRRLLSAFSLRTPSRDRTQPQHVTKEVADVHLYSIFSLSPGCPAEYEPTVAITADLDIELVRMADGEEEEAVIAPLIAGQRCDRDAIFRPPPQESDLSSPNRFIWALTLTAGISGLLFGYECEKILPNMGFGVGSEIVTAPV